MADIGRQFYDSMSPGEHKIAQLELSMVLYALVARPDKFRGRRGVWYIDNVAALMCLIRGRSDSPDLERSISLSFPFRHGFTGSGSLRNQTGPTRSVKQSWLKSHQKRCSSFCQVAVGPSLALVFVRAVFSWFCSFVPWRE